MAPKGSMSTRLNPLRLNSINHLRIRRPNQNEANSCVTVMSSMLSMFIHLLLQHQIRQPSSPWLRAQTPGYFPEIRPRPDR